MHFDTIVDYSTLRAPQTIRLFHGTPVRPEDMGACIQPVQARTSTSHGRVIDHGPRPAVSTSTNCWFPAIRSLLHPKHVDFVGVELYPLLSRGANAAQAAYIFTAAAAIQRMVERQSQGFVYGSERLPACAERFASRKDLAEWRVYEPLVWDWAVTSSVYDLPPDLLVIDADESTAREFIRRFTASNTPPLELSVTLGMTVTPLHNLL
jgi:hypothetical protein